mgnify:CR=1 FL=1
MIQAHRRRFSKTKSGGVWDTDFDAMARKTVIRNMLSKWGILSIDMQMAESLETKQEDDTVGFTFVFLLANAPFMLSLVAMVTPP